MPSSRCFTFAVVLGSCLALSARAGSPKRPAGDLAPGTRVQFDRVEATRPELGRWDVGVIVGRDFAGRLQIRGDNGILYAIREDPRWILPLGAPLPGPKHDAYEAQAPPPGQPVGPPSPPARPANGTGGVAPGHYICSSFSEQVMGLAFRVTGPGAYTFDAGGGGTVRLDAATRQVSFTGPLGELMRDDQLTALYITRNGKPEVAFQSARGGPVAGCFPQ